MPEGYDRSVFINCPFDAEYQPILHAMVFAVHDCGFRARTALEVDDGGEVRMAKIKRMIRECGYGIHDISRVQPDHASGLPRFNMPLQLGLFLGAQEYGSREQRRKRSLVLDTERYRYQVFCSDLAGQDVRAHGNDPARAVAAVRAMLATALEGKARVPGVAAILARYTDFLAELPDLCDALYIDCGELQFVEFRSLIATWLAQHPLGYSSAGLSPWDVYVPYDMPPFAYPAKAPGVRG
ncbi:MAG TPA: hypothetical protein VFJ82_03400 [Longimicrobium sp.]|nr:hypothetical protein [Longimicrobium sp.]